jgi:hypothetical protein
MPKASMDKEGLPSLGECNIGAARQPFVVDPKAVSKAM